MQIKKTIYILGGPPRIGKSKAARMFTRATGISHVCTDEIREALKAAVPYDYNPDLFVIDKSLEHLHDADRIRQYNTDPGSVVELQNTESRAMQDGIHGFVTSTLQEGSPYLVEGVALLPEFVYTWSGNDIRICFMGCTNPRHWEQMYQSARENESDWLHTKNKEYIKSFGTFVCALSDYFKKEAQKYNMPYIEIDDDNFEKSLQQVVELLTSNAK